MTIHYEIIVWSGDDNILTPSAKGEIEFYTTKEAKEAFEHYKQNIMNGFIWSYITVKKHYDYGSGKQVEYGNEMADCWSLTRLPKYIKKNLGPLVDYVCPDFETYEEAKAFFE